MSISVLESFSEYPGLRHCSISDESGELFYHNVLNDAFANAINDGYGLEVILDNTAGYAPSFLDEAFGNLVYDFGMDLVSKHLKIISTDEPYWVEMLNNETFPQWEERRSTGNDPKITASHEPWIRFIKGKMVKQNWVEPS
ncbi:MAG TPA: hypothetical protein DCE78_09960 [Bacteroidetes bacterium]|nr:hypothetical protein [Bacteroidota bacterium]